MKIKVRRIDFYPDDWLAGTLELSDAECGVYVRACALIYARGGPIGVLTLKRACSSHGNTFNHILKRLEITGKLLRKGDEIVSKRCRIELERASIRLRKASENGAKGNKIRWNGIATRSGTAIANNHQPSTIIQQEELLPSFDSPSLTKKPPAKPKKPTPAPLEQWGASPAHLEQARAAGHDEVWLYDQADRYRDQQANAKLKHRDREAGFRNWIRNAPNYEVKANGHANGHRKLSAVDNLFLGAARAAEAVARRQRLGGSSAPPLLDSR